MRLYSVKRVVMPALLLVILVGLAFGLTAPTKAQTDDTGRQLTVGQPVTGTLNPANFVQNYVFAASIADTVSLSATTTSEGLVLVLVLVAPDGEIIAQDGDISTPQEATVSNVRLPQNGTYVVMVMRGSGAEGDTSGEFTLTLTGQVTPPTATPVTPETVLVPGQAVFVTLEEGGIDFSLTWAAAVDMNLEVRDPVGGSVFFASTTVPSGGLYDADANAECTNASADNPTETVNWPTGPVPAGSYEVLIHYVNGCSVGGPQTFTLTAAVNGEEARTISGVLNPGQDHLARLTLDTSKAWSLFNGGVNAGLDVVVDRQTQPLVKGEALLGVISNQKPKDFYTFEAATGETLEIAMNATNGSLDPLVILIGPDGQRLADNDDLNDESRNSFLRYSAATAGTYTLIATRYGQVIGGTEGGYSLTVTSGTEVATQPTATADSEVVVTPTDGTRTPGSIEVLLTWDTAADLQLQVRDPSGATVYDDVDRIPSGGALDPALQGNRNCTPAAGTPTYYVFWPQTRQPPIGTYEVEVWYQDDCDDVLPITFELTVNVGGQEVIKTQQNPVAVGNRYMITFTLNQDRAGTAGTGGFFAMNDVTSGLDYAAQLGAAQPISYDDTVNGVITLDQRFQIYSFEGNAGDRISISMTKVGTSSLDPALYIMTPDNVQLAFNDDIEPGVDVNSRIDRQELPQDGTYYIIATHYGLQYGATTGSFTLRLALLP